MNPGVNLVALSTWGVTVVDISPETKSVVNISPWGVSVVNINPWRLSVLNISLENGWHQLRPWGVYAFDIGLGCLGALWYHSITNWLQSLSMWFNHLCGWFCWHWPALNLHPGLTLLSFDSSFPFLPFWSILIAWICLWNCLNVCRWQCAVTFNTVLLSLEKSKTVTIFCNWWFQNNRKIKWGNGISLKINSMSQIVPLHVIRKCNKGNVKIATSIWDALFFRGSNLVHLRF